MVHAPDKVKGNAGKNSGIQRKISTNQRCAYYTVASNRIIDVNKPMRQPELLREMFAQCLYAITLGGVMTGSKIMNTALPCHVHGLLRDFTADEGIQAVSGCRLNV